MAATGPEDQSWIVGITAGIGALSAALVAWLRYLSGRSRHLTADGVRFREELWIRIERLESEIKSLRGENETLHSEVQRLQLLCARQADQISRLEADLARRAPSLFGPGDD